MDNFNGKFLHFDELFNKICNFVKINFTIMILSMNQTDFQDFTHGKNMLWNDQESLMN